MTASAIIKQYLSRNGAKGGRSRSPAKLRACRQNAKKAAKARKIRRGVCRRCGCTDDAACGDPIFGSCTWTDKSHTLCSACLNPKERKEFLNRL